jgi:protein disulfide-isomerase A4
LYLPYNLTELGKHFKDSKNVVIAKVDATTNTLPKDLQVSGYPTLISFAKGVRHVYTGAHDLESLIAFVQTSLV